MAIVDERTVPADLAPAVIDAIRAHGLYPWIYRGAEWYITDPDAPHAAHEASTIQFPPTVVPSYDGLLERAVKIVGVSDGYDKVERCEAAVRQQFGTRLSLPVAALLPRCDASDGQPGGRSRAPVALLQDPAGADRHARRRRERCADVPAERLACPN
jgi:hypothetical protein